MSESRGGLERLEALLEPEQYLPTQVPPARRRDSLICGEKALMLAALEDAIRCLSGRGRAGARLAREADKWIRADDHHWPFSFVNICAALDLDERRLRAALLARVATGRQSYRLHLRLKSTRARLHTSAEAAQVAELPKRAAHG